VEQNQEFFPRGTTRGGELKNSMGVQEIGLGGKREQGRANEEGGKKVLFQNVQGKREKRETRVVKGVEEGSAKKRRVTKKHDYL